MDIDIDVVDRLICKEDRQALVLFGMAHLQDGSLGLLACQHIFWVLGG